jgi:nucleoside-diphosphate-sugar epimerase
MKHVFITGATGFIGSYVAEEFVNRGWHVTALVHRKDASRLAHLNSTGRITYANGDITSYDSLKTALLSIENGAHAIVHCAGRASDVGWRSTFRQTNLTSVEHLVRLTKQLNVGRFVFISTTDVYGLRDFSGESENELSLKAYPRNPYPEFKILAEAFIRRELSPDRFSILRPAQVWGVGDTTLTARIVDFLRWSPWIVHFGKWRGKNRWPLAHVRNVAMASYLAATMPESAGHAINVLDNERTSMDEFYRILSRIYLPQKDFKTITLPFSIGYLIGAAVSAISNVLNLDHPFMDPSLYALYSVSRNLDFSNESFRSLTVIAGENIVTLEKGVQELERENTKK